MTRAGMRWRVALAAPAVAVLAGCGAAGGDGGHTAAPTPPVPSDAGSTTGAPPAPTATPARSGGRPPTCTTGRLRITPGQRGGAAGSTVVQLVFTNIGDGTCAVAGFPGVSFVAGDRGRQVGSPARRQTGRYRSVELAPGQAAHASFAYPQVANFPSGRCHPTPVRGLRVYPPDQTAAVFVPLPTRACAVPGVGVPEIAALRPGRTG